MHFLSGLCAYADEKKKASASLLATRSSEEVPGMVAACQDMWRLLVYECIVKRVVCLCSWEGEGVGAAGNALERGGAGDGHRLPGYVAAACNDMGWYVINWRRRRG